MSYARSQKLNIPRVLKQYNIQPNLLFGLIIATALIFFELFNYSTTDFALRDLLGELRFFGIRWATTLSIAFCGIDFAGVARLFMPDRNNDEPKEVWYLFGAWIIAATMNAALTWWGVSMAIANHSVQSTSVVDPMMIMKVVPIFVAVMVWTIRILIIGTISVAGSRMFGNQSKPARKPKTKTKAKSTQPALGLRTGSNAYNRSTNTRAAAPGRTYSTAGNTRTNRNSSSAYPRSNAGADQGNAIQEPTYHNLSMSASSRDKSAENRSSNSHILK